MPRELQHPDQELGEEIARILQKMDVSPTDVLTDEALMKELTERLNLTVIVTDRSVMEYELELIEQDLADLD